MYKYYDNKLKREINNLGPGEYLSSDEDIVINTVLGSCVSVVLFDPILKAGGFNHFMLADVSLNTRIDNFFKVERYGLYAMESLINDFLKRGSKKSNLKAKVFGGSRMLETQRVIDIGAENIRFAEEFLKTEKIPIISQDTGGSKAMKIYLYTKTFRILLKRVDSRTTELYQQMEAYKKKLKEEKDGGIIVLF
ncbi:MAG: chemotaxis protein CheD [Spirochaetales bacterium]|nr:chemotaxis protein CheD [Spirochaetales bacterium]